MKIVASLILFFFILIGLGSVFKFTILPSKDWTMSLIPDAKDECVLAAFSEKSFNDKYGLYKRSKLYDSYLKPTVSDKYFYKPSKDKLLKHIIGLIIT